MKKRQRSWTTALELNLLCQYWARLARREKRKFALDGFSEKATRRKLQELKLALKPEYFELPLHTPYEELPDILAACKSLGTKEGRVQAANGQFGNIWQQESADVVRARAYISRPLTHAALPAACAATALAPLPLRQACCCSEPQPSPADIPTA